MKKALEILGLFVFVALVFTVVAFLGISLGVTPPESITKVGITSITVGTIIGLLFLGCYLIKNGCGEYQG